MKLKSVKIENFRAIKTLKLELHPQMIVLVGDNGAGKTSLLDALAYGLSPIPEFFVEGHEPRYFRRADFRLTHREKQTFAPFVSIELENQQELRWTYKRLLGYKQPEAEGLAPLEAHLRPTLQAILSQAAPLDIPVLAYYGNARGSFYLPAKKDRWGEERGKPRDTFPRLEALRHALNENPRFWGTFDWFAKQEDLERREREKRHSWSYTLPILEFVREAICGMIAGAANPRTEPNPDRFLVDLPAWSEKQTLSLDQLSDGYRTLLAIVMDLARRMAQANPHRENPLHTDAIVLIDEVDLHLHPRWQQTVLLDLQRVFPNTQFIVTTHSPQVLTTVHQDNILLLETGPEGITAYTPLISPYGAESERALEIVMRVPPRPEHLEEVQKLNKYMELVNHGDYASKLAQDLRRDLEQTLGPQETSLKLADMIIRKHKALGV
jgi:predicted ATP-binding protein involved in virulence